MDSFSEGARSDSAEESARRLRFLSALNWGWLGMGAIALVSIPFYTPKSLLLSVILGATVSTFLLVRFLIGHGLVREAGIVFVLLVDAGLFAVFAVQAAEIGLANALKTETPALMMMGLAVLFAGALVDPRAPFLVGFLNSVVLVALVSNARGDDPRFSIHIFWWLLALAAWLYERTLEDAFGRLSAGRRDLQILVDRRTGELRETVTALEASNRELDAFTSAVSHDLRAPVRSVIGFSDALFEDHAAELPPSGLEHLNRVRNAGRRMNSLIEDLLHLSRVSRPELHREEVELGSVARLVVEELRRAEPGRKLDYLSPESLAVLGDPRLLRLLLENLLGNAWKFTRPRDVARIELGETKLGEERVCFVRDNGVGFDMAYSDKLFRPFQRLHSTEEFDGSGIGL
ncbi:MAG TPA: histidine kinase dimerization/phospho-acceptor domain-containing protein, partial [Vicinamibacteria bacterium]|nr:histidine kinase dimerization/phospho-acceptor domain-containing protein [Vicinamibacteria bacterium]